MLTGGKIKSRIRFGKVPCCLLSKDLRREVAPEWGVRPVEEIIFVDLAPTCAHSLVETFDGESDEYILSAVYVTPL